MARENKFGMDIASTEDQEISAPWAMKVTATHNSIKWESEKMSGEFIYITPRSGLSDTVVKAGTVIGQARGPRVRFQISDMDPRIIVKLLELSKQFG